jgi:hypothetical protein
MKIYNVCMQVNNWSIEDLELYLEIGQETREGVHDTILENLLLESAEWDAARGLVISSTLRCQLPKSRARWRLHDQRPEKKYGKFPVYLSESRTVVAVEVFVEVGTNIPECVWAQRGVAFVMQTSTVL